MSVSPSSPQSLSLFLALTTPTPATLDYYYRRYHTGQKRRTS